jgi:sugar lactone lactonase YvrE
MSCLRFAGGAGFVSTSAKAPQNGGRSPAMTTDLTETPRIVQAGLHLPECPRWRGERLFFSDMYGETVWALAETGEAEALCRVEGRPGGLGFAAHGDLLINEMERARVLRLSKAGELSVHADLSGFADSINDMITTPDGRCFVGRLTMEPPFDPAPLMTVAPDGRASIATEEPVLVANGMVMRAGGRTLIVAESVAGRLLAYDVADGGGLSNRRVFADMPEGHGPDGICGDDAGGIWLASPNVGRFLRVVEGGEVTHRISLPPGRFAYACAIGGADRQTLFLCTSGHYDPTTCKTQTNGRIEAVRSPFPNTGDLP